MSKEEYDSCHITNINARKIAICDKPDQFMYFTITFRSFTPQPGGLEFKPGQDYYFISTSSGSPHGLDQKLAGRCATHNMKVIFKVCCHNNSKDSAADSVNNKSNKRKYRLIVNYQPINLIIIRNQISKSFLSRTFCPENWFNRKEVHFPFTFLSFYFMVSKFKSLAGEVGSMNQFHVHNSSDFTFYVH